VSYSQNTKISLDVRNETVEDILNKITSQTEYKFFIDTEIVDLERLVSVTAKDEKVSVILTKIFFGTTIYFEFFGNQIIFKKSLFDPKTSRKDFQKEISGAVTDKKGAPLFGVNIVTKNKITGTDTDFDGKYNLKASIGDTLIYSYVGMITRKVAVRDTTSILNVSLTIDANELEEVVVSIGYGVKKDIHLSGAVGYVGNEYFKSRPIVNVGQALQGVIGNLNITNSASPNDVALFNIRGFTSISGGEPLVVIDGVTATQQDLGRMNPNDIASISILKDAASASIYGSRASFGVVLVTTKEGESDKIQININLNKSIKSIGRTPELELDPYKVLSFKDVMAVPWYDLYSHEQLEYAKQVSFGNAAPTRVSPTNPNKYEFYHQTNWKDIVFKKISFTNTANIDISQKVDKGSYYFAIEGITNEGIYEYNNDLHKRLNFRFKGEYDLSDWLTLRNSVWIYNNNYDESNATGASFFRSIINSYTFEPIYTPEGIFTDSAAHMIGRLEAGNYTTEENNYQVNFAVNMNFFDAKLKVVADANFKKLLTDREAYDAPVVYSDGPGHRGTIGPSESWARFQNWKEETNNYNVYATFTDTFNSNHDVTVLVGYNQEEFKYNTTSGSRTNLISTGFPTVDLATGDQQVGQEKSSWAVQGFFSRINYIFKDKYIIEGNIRYDGSSRYFVEDRWAYNPSTSASWIVSKENFLEKSIFDLLKLRVSYGSLGNQNASTYGTYSFLNTGITESLIGGENLVEVGSPRIIAPSFSWESIVTKNIGVDLAFFDKRLRSSFDYFHRSTLDMFAPGETLPVVLGTNVPDENATDLITKGWELSIGWNDQFDLLEKKFRYSFNFNLSDNRSWITKFPNPTKNLNDYRVGQEIGEIWGFVTDGYFQTQEEIDFSPTQVDISSYPSTRPIAPGDIKIKDLDGNGSIDFGDNTFENPGDRKIIGNSRARYNFGMNINSSWNGVDFRAFIQGVGKRDFYPESNASRYYFWSAFAFPWASVTKENYYNHWTPENRDAFYPRLKSYVAEGGKEVSNAQTRWLQDASYIRLKNVTVGYTIPRSLNGKIGLNKFRLYLSGENLFEITKLFKYLDPENLQGDGYPFRRTYSLGLSLSF